MKGGKRREGDKVERHADERPPRVPELGVGGYMRYVAQRRQDESAEAAPKWILDLRQGDAASRLQQAVFGALQV